MDPSFVIGTGMAGCPSRCSPRATRSDPFLLIGLLLALLLLTAARLAAAPLSFSDVPVPSQDAPPAGMAAPHTPGPSVQDPTPLAPGASLTIEAINMDADATNNGGFMHIPPDPIAAAGPNHVVNMVNTSIEVYTRAGANVSSTSLKSFFSGLLPGTTSDPTTDTFDPKVIYDQHAGRFVVCTLERLEVLTGSPTDESSIFVAVSATSDPTGTWYAARLNGKITIGVTDYWSDYPGFAVDEEAVYLTYNLFTFGATRSYGGMRLWVIDKTPFYTGGAMVFTVQDPYGAIGQSPTGTRPAHVYGPATATLGTYLVAYSGLSDGTNEYVRIIQLDNPLTAPSYSFVDIPVGNIDNTSLAMPDAPQPGAGSLDIETNDRRTLNAVWRGEQLWVCSQIVPSTGEDAGECTVHWWEFDTTGGVATTTLVQQGSIGMDGGTDEDIATYMPAIACNSLGEMAIGFSASGPSLFAGAYYTGRVPTDPPGSVQPIATLATGVAKYERRFGSGRNRWGDYSGMVVDPVDDVSFWVYNEYALAEAVTPDIFGETGRWGTRYGTFSFTDATTLPGVSTTYFVYVDGSNNLVVDDGTTTFFSKPLAGVIGLKVNGTAVSETVDVTIDGLNSTTLPSGLELVLGEAGGDADKLITRNATGVVTLETHDLDGPEQGSFLFDTLDLTYEETELVETRVVATDRVINVEVTGPQSLRVSDVVPNDGLTRLDETATGAFVDTEFLPPLLGRVTINAGDGDDTIVMTDVDAAYPAPIEFNGEDGSDSLQVNFSSGIPPLLAAVIYNGGGPTGTDSLVVIGDGAVSAIYTPDTATAGDGTITLGAIQPIQFTGLEPITVQNMGTLTFVTPNSNDTLLVDVPAPGQNRISGSSGGVAFEAITFLLIPAVTLDTATNDGVLADDVVVVDPAGFQAGGLGQFNVITGPGDDVLECQTSTLALPMGGPVSYDSGPGNDRLEVTGPGQYQLADPMLVLAGGASGNVVFIPPIPELAVLNGGNSPTIGDILNASLYSQPVQLYGFDGPDQLIGTNNNDILAGGPGNDVLDGVGGVDTLDGGPGDDRYAIDLSLIGGPLAISDSGSSTGDELVLAYTPAADMIGVTSTSATGAGPTVSYDASIEMITANLLAGDDFVVVLSSPTATMNIAGDTEGFADTLVFDAQGQPAVHNPSGGGAGTIDQTSRQTVSYTGMESVQITNTPTGVEDWMVFSD